MKMKMQRGRHGVVNGGRVARHGGWLLAAMLCWHAAPSGALYDESGCLPCAGGSWGVRVRVAAAMRRRLWQPVMRIYV